ncbi:MAG: glycosyltransferase family 4 protein [Chloroflexota bacterium]
MITRSKNRQVQKWPASAVHGDAAGSVIEEHAEWPQVTVVARGVHPPWNEGTRVIARNIALALESASCSTSTISLSESLYAQYEGQGSKPIEHIPSRISYGVTPDYVYLRKIARAVNKATGNCGPAAIHLVGAPLALSPLISKPNRKIIAHITLSQQVYLSVAERLRARVGWRVFDHWVDAYACTSQQIYDDLLRQGYDRQKLHVISPPIDVQRFKPIPKAEARAMAGLDPDAFIVAYIGTVSPRRFPTADIVAALRAMAPTVPNLLLEIFAPVATHKRNKEWADDNVRQEAEGANFPVNVHLQDLTESEKALIYSAVDVVLLPFTAAVAVEPPLTLLEAMACGAAVVVAPHANRSNVVTDGFDGLLFGSVEELTVRLTNLYEIGQEGRALLGKEARATVLQQYTFAKSAEAIKNLWSSIGM